MTLPAVPSPLHQRPPEGTLISVDEPPRRPPPRGVFLRSCDFACSASTAVLDKVTCLRLLYSVLQSISLSRPPHCTPVHRPASAPGNTDCVCLHSADTSSKASTVISLSENHLVSGTPALSPTPQQQLVIRLLAVFPTFISIVLGYIFIFLILY